MTSEQDELQQRADELYDRYAKPYEDQNRGRFIAISPEGRVLLGDDVLDVTEQATKAFGRGNFIFKLGPRAVGRWR